MTRSIVVAVAALVLSAAAGASTGATPGVTPTTVTIGSSGPLTGDAGAAAGVLKGAAAYFRYVNGRGGVNGRQIRFVYLDDGYDPARTDENVRELVQQDNVFALFSVVGSEENLAIRDFANASGVPQVFSAAGATILGRDSATYPWTIGYPPPYAEEGALYAKQILATSPGATVAVLYQDDAYGRDLLAGFRKGLGARAKQLLVQAVGYDPAVGDVQAQVAQLQATGANTFMVFAFGAFAAQAFEYADELGWKPQVYVDGVASASWLMRRLPQAAAEGAVSILWVKDPATPTFTRDPGVVLARSIVERYGAGGSSADDFLVGGMAEAYSFVDALKAAGRNLSRRALMNAVTHMNEASNPFLAPGVTVHTTPTSRFPITAMQLQRWHNRHWVPFGGVVSTKF
jgi:branched-chain amino acid transport system substrate-binding protein